ncbi:MAG: flagellar filament capping protein FliD [Planctomycetes bacterium]|nr:flagellar filament capping protein FliD [Planctomycetota bacterium]
MGTITSSVGLISGIDTKSLIDQLIAIEARPRDQVNNQVTVFNSQKTAFLEINARVLALNGTANTLGGISLFKTNKTLSSNESVLSASASNAAIPGTYSFTVDKLVSTNQLITSGFADPDTTPIGAGTLSFTSAQAKLTRDVKLTSLNGGTGVQRGKIRITDRAGNSADIDLTKAVSLDDVLTAINNNTTIGVTASLDGDHLKLTDTTGSTTTNLAVANLGSSTTATDLGLAANSGGTNTISGSQINKIVSTTNLNALNDGNGIRVLNSTLSDFHVDLGGTGFDVTLKGSTTVQDVVDKINNATGNPGVTASIGADGVSLQLAGTGTITVTALNSSNAAKDLGILGSASNTLAGSRLLAGLGSTLLSTLHGGAGLDTSGGSTLSITNRTGAQTDIELSTARSVSDVISLINSASAGVTASLNNTGNGLTLTDTTGSTASNLIITDPGNLASDLGISTGAAGVAASSVKGTGLDHQYINGNTRLDSLNQGKGVTAGKFKITNSNGVSATVDLTQGDETTLQKVIDEINTRSIGVTASINATGDGLLLTDSAGGALKLKVEESGSTTARDLGILGSDDDADGKIDGSFKVKITVSATDKLNDVVTKINAAGTLVSASVINDGSSSNGYRLSFTSRRSGEAGQIAFDDGGLGITSTTLVKGSDAVVFFGSSDPTQALLVTSSTNKLTNTVAGVTINLNGTSASPVELTVARDDEAVSTAIGSFVSSFNSVMDTLDKYDTYNADTNTRGLLLGDPTVSQVRNRLNNLVLGKLAVSGQYQYLTQIGINIGDGGHLTFDQEKFDAAFATNPAAVQDLFTAITSNTDTSSSNLPAGVTVPNTASVSKSIGFGKLLIDLTQQLTNSVDGLLTLKTNSIDAQVTLANKRIDDLTTLLTNKRTILENKFAAMESALASIQSQQNALASLNKSS